MSLPDPYPFRTSVKVTTRDGRACDRRIETRETNMDEPKAPATYPVTYQPCRHDSGEPKFGGCCLRAGHPEPHRDLSGNRWGRQHDNCPPEVKPCKAYVVEPGSGKGPKRLIIAPDAMVAARIFVAAVKGPVVYTVNDLIHREVPEGVMEVPTNVIGVWVPGEHVRAALGWGPEDLRSATDIAAGRAGPSFRP